MADDVVRDPACPNPAFARLVAIRPFPTRDYSIEAAKVAQLRDRVRAIATLLANFDDVSLHDPALSPLVRDQYLRAAQAAIELAQKAPQL